VEQHLLLVTSFPTPPDLGNKNDHSSATIYTSTKGLEDLQSTLLVHQIETHQGGPGDFGVNKILTLFARSHTVAHLLNKFWRDGGN
jgi:hypothetical protein